MKGDVPPMSDPGHPPFVGNRLLALSWREGSTPPAHVARRLAPFVVHSRGTAALYCERPDCFARGEHSAAALGTRRLLTPGRSGILDAAALLAQLPAFPEPGAPGVAIAAHEGRLTGWTDRFGIGQLFWYRNDAGLAALSTSSTLLAELFDRELDSTALTGFALTGSFLGEDTAFARIAKVPLGRRAVLIDGDIRFEETNGSLSPSEEGESTLEEVTEAFVAAVRRMLAAFPDAELELSGGLDSRLILAAIPPELRRGRPALTIGPAASSEAAVATHIALREGLDHRIVATDGFDRLTADEFDIFIERIALGYDHLANPLDKIAIVSAGLDDRSEAAARFGGQNGEILRGFYYPAQPLGRAPGVELARRLVAWRIEANDRVNGRLLSAPGYPDRAAAVRNRLVQTLLQGGESRWWQALDRFYLTERMPRWVGAGSTNRFISRTSLFPFFDPEFVSAAMRLRGDFKRNSRAAYRMLTRLDPGLSAIPLDNGIVPSRSGSGSGGSEYFNNNVNLIMKLIQKAYNRVLGWSKPVLGSVSAIEYWYGLSLFKRLPVKELNATGMVEGTVVESIAKAHRRFDRASLGWLLLVASLIGSEEWRATDGFPP